MVEVLRNGGALLGGMGLGVFFFAGLWWTVRKAVVAENPALLFLSSMMLRTLGTMAGFYFLSRGDWRKVVASLAGFLLARVLITRLLGSTREADTMGRLGEAQ